MITLRQKMYAPKEGCGVGDATLIFRRSVSQPSYVCWHAADTYQTIWLA